MGTREATGDRHAWSAGRRRLVTVGLAMALIGAGAACGGGGTKAPVAVAAADSTTTTTDASAAYAACLKDHGVNLPDRTRPTDGTGASPSSRPDGTPPSSRAPGNRPSTSFPPGSRPSTSLPAGVDPAQVTAARQACASLQPANRGVNGPQRQAFQAYTSCMKDHGVTVGAGGPGGLDREDPAFKAGDAICAPLRPTQP